MEGGRGEEGGRAGGEERGAIRGNEHQSVLH